jgi:hypothetical protein
MRRRNMILLALGVLTLVVMPSASLILAQIGNSRIEAQSGRSQVYRVRIINELGEPVRVGMIGFERDANLRLELRSGQSFQQMLYGGERVVVAWDRNRNLIYATEVVINGNGKLRLQNALPMMGGPARSAPGGAAAAAPNRQPLPTADIESDN